MLKSAFLSKDAELALAVIYVTKAVYCSYMEC